MKYKAEVIILLISISLFVVSVLFYSHSNHDPATTESQVFLSSSLPIYPYRGYGLASVGFGALLMATAAVSYSKRSEKGFDKLCVLTQNKTDEQPN